MALSHELISQFAKIVKGNTKQSTESTVYGTVVTDGNGNKYVKLDGSDQLTPLSDDERPSADSTTTSANEGERVSVLIKNHTATVTGNISSPSVRTGDFNDLSDQVTDIKKFDIVIAKKVQANEAYIKKLQTDKAEVKDLTAATAKITELEAKKASVDDLNAAKADITDLKTNKIDADVANAKFATIENLNAANALINNLDANKADIESLNAAKADITDLKTNKIDADVANAKFATIENLNAANALINNLDANKADIESLNTANAKITELESTKLDAEQAALKYATIDFGNITEAAIEKVFSDSGIIKDLVVSEGHITGELVGVTIKGDIIEGGTVKADKLVILGENGLYYKLNVNSLGETTAKSDPKYQNGLDGSVIIAKSITAEKVTVDDLVAFGATIGGFHIGDHSLYSGVKSSATNTTRGVFLGDDGQIAFGDSNNFIKYYKDTDGTYKLAISAESLVFSTSNKNVQDTIDEVKSDVDTLRDEVQSRGENLITNGTAMLGDNTNFTYFKYDGKESYYSGGSFKYTGTGWKARCNELIPVDIANTYTFSYWIKNNNTNATNYDMLIMYDIDKNEIKPYHTSWTDGSTTELVQDLNDGDTVVYLQSVSGFKKSNNNKGLIFWNYVNSRGYQYGVETYSRNRWGNLWSNANSFDSTNNTITLKAPWSHGHIPSGTSVSQTISTGEYLYLNTGFKLSKANSWEKKTGTITGVGRNLVYKGGQFMEGTAFVKVGWVTNQSQTPSVTTWLTNISLTQNAGVNDVNDLNIDVANVEKTANSTATTVNSTVTRLSKAESDIQLLADNIVTLVTDADGSSYMTQTSSGWTFSTTDIQKTVGEISDGLSNLDTTVGNTKDAVEYLKGRLGNLEDYIYIGEYTYTDSEGVEQTDMCIELGGRNFGESENGNDFKLRITKNRIEFFEGSDVPAYISNNAMNIEQAVVKGELQIGDSKKETLSGVFVWKVRDNNHLGLSWVEKAGVSE